ncbi:MAG TPA: GNAT family N-acetyltransferase [Methanospirillum sp.]|nr:GNAT family N-acetyltransferase [Methanospirillum sp.]
MEAIGEGVRFQVVNSWNCDDIISLYRSAGWWDESFAPEGIPALITGSYLFVVGFLPEEKRAVAMGRILSDSVLTGYIQDLCVQEGMRGRAIGTGLLRFLIRAAIDAGLSRLYLIAETGTEGFYIKSGFIRKEGLIFLIQNPDDYS